LTRSDARCAQTYEARFIDIESGTALEDVIEGTAGSLVWGNDNSVVYYSKMDEQHRPYQLWRHVMGAPVSEDVLLFEEKDERLW
jgi:oligopeptidase B